MWCLATCGLAKKTSNPIMIFFMYISTRPYNFNWVDRIFNCVFRQIRCLSVSLLKPYKCNLSDPSIA